MPWLSETLQQRMPLTLLFLRVRWRLARDRTQQDHAAKLNAEAFAYFHNASQKKRPQEARPEAALCRSPAAVGQFSRCQIGADHVSRSRRGAFAKWSRDCP